MNFPSRHPLNQSASRAALTQADVILGLETNDIWAAANSFTDRIVRTSRPTAKKGAKIVTLGTRDLYLKSNYQDFARYQDLDLAIAGDGGASLPALTEAVKRLLDDGRKSAFQARGKQLAGLRLAPPDRVPSHPPAASAATPTPAPPLRLSAPNHLT